MLSLLSSLFIIVTYQIFHRSFKWRKSQFLRWAIRLVVVNGLFSLVALVWNYLSSRVDEDSSVLEDYCRVYLPFPIYFFVCGYGNLFIFKISYDNIVTIVV
jgi:hypothetical protein